MIIIENRNLLLNEFQKNIKIAEIGVFKGEFSKKIFELLSPSELHLIDLFEGDMCSGDKDGNNIVWTNLQEEYIKLKEYFSNNKNVFLHKGFSYEILSSFPDNYFDMIYVDGDHTYEGVKKDLNIVFDKIKNNGFICGHDYTQFMFPGVVKAVNEFCFEKKQEISHLTNDGCPTFMINLKKYE
jgi:hypothetical protein